MKSSRNTTNPFLATRATAPKAKGAKHAMPTLPMDNGSLSVRKIENGFLITQSGMKGKGKNSQYVSRDYFSPTKPNIKFTK